jgi:hypothetical protein
LTAAASFIYPINSTPIAGTELTYFGIQVEVGNGVTSYIPTTNAAVTRAVDIASMTGTNFSTWYNAPTGTYFVDCLYTAKPAGDTQYAFGSAADVDNQQAPSLYANATNYITGISAGSTQPSVNTGNTTGVGSRSRVAFNYVEGDRRASLNGRSVVRANYTLGAANRLNFGAGWWSPGGGVVIAAIKYWKTAKTDAELIELTTP